MVKDVLIIGAGISGLIAGRKLQERGMTVQLLEKSRGPGGRMSTRWMEDGKIDHGAQFFSARTSSFQEVVDEWVSLGVAKCWFGEGVRKDGGGRSYCGVPYMNAIPRLLAQELDIKTHWTAERLVFQEGVWHVSSKEGEIVKGRSLLITSPVPQTLAILERSSLSLSHEDEVLLSSIKYGSCFAVFGWLDKAPAIPAPGLLEQPNEDIARIIDNVQKGITTRPSVTIHASASFTSRHLDEERVVVGERLLEAAAEYLSSMDRETMRVHRWLYSRPKQTVDGDGFLQLKGSGPLYVAGDGFASPTVEGAVLSGLSVADVIYADTQD